MVPCKVCLGRGRSNQGCLEQDWPGARLTSLGMTLDKIASIALRAQGCFGRAMLLQERSPLIIITSIRIAFIGITSSEVALSEVVQVRSPQAM